MAEEQALAVQLSPTEMNCGANLGWRMSREDKSMTVSLVKVHDAIVDVSPEERELKLGLGDRSVASNKLVRHRQSISLAQHLIGQYRVSENKLVVAITLQDHPLTCTSGCHGE